MKKASWARSREETFGSPSESIRSTPLEPADRASEGAPESRAQYRPDRPPDQEAERAAEKHPPPAQGSISDDRDIARTLPVAMRIIQGPAGGAGATLVPSRPRIRPGATAPAASGRRPPPEREDAACRSFAGRQVRTPGGPHPHHRQPGAGAPRDGAVHPRPGRPASTPPVTSPATAARRCTTSTRSCGPRSDSSRTRASISSPR